jgi:hypothetical protein
MRGKPCWHTCFAVRVLFVSFGFSAAFRTHAKEANATTKQNFARVKEWLVEMESLRILQMMVVQKTV